VPFGKTVFIVMQHDHTLRELKGIYKSIIEQISKFNTAIGYKTNININCISLYRKYIRN
jgi:hypothetical protein